MKSKSIVRRKQRRQLAALVWASLLWVPAHSQSGQALYSPTKTVSGTIRIWGSPQMGDLLNLYEQGFHKLQPNVKFENQLHSTLTAVPAVYTDRAEIGLLGRELWPVEQQAFRSVKGHAPTVLEIATGAYDVPKATFALMMFVNASNPLTQISTSELERVFSNTSKASPIKTWGDLGLTGEWQHKPVHLYGFQTDNDKSIIFRSMVFTDGNGWNCRLHQFGNDETAKLDAGEAILRAVAHDPAGIGISNIHYASPSVRALAVAPPHSRNAVAPTRQNVATRRYPFTRAVFIVLDHSSAQSANPAVVEFVTYILSKQGADDVEREGNYLPLPMNVAARQLQEFGADKK